MHCHYGLPQIAKRRQRVASSAGPQPRSQTLKRNRRQRPQQRKKKKRAVMRRRSRYHGRTACDQRKRGTSGYARVGQIEEKGPGKKESDDRPFLFAQPSRRARGGAHVSLCMLFLLSTSAIFHAFRSVTPISPVHYYLL